MTEIGMTELKSTGVYATKEELEALQRIASQGWRDGDMMIVFSVAEGVERDQKTVDARKACHALALKHGLPEIEGYYGITPSGQFVTF